MFIDDVTENRSSRMNSEVYREILSSQIQPNTAKLIGRRFIVKMEDDLKHTAKALHCADTGDVTSSSPTRGIIYKTTTNKVKSDTEKGMT